MLVVIDKAGMVRSVHVGYSPDIGETLEDELDVLLHRSESKDNGYDPLQFRYGLSPSIASAP
ncbi:MAG TPA: hypothetical protein VNH11_04760 [Pirellulales bacterium]|nr:hypothetical protein [Pirellulales bacterium]